MQPRHAFAAIAILLFVQQATAQSRWVMDRKNKLVGQLIGNEARPALIRFALRDDDTVLLEATPYGLRSAAGTRVLFSTPACDGMITGAQIYMEATVLQLTQKQAVVINTYGPSPTALQTSELYVTPVPFPTATQLPAGSVMPSTYFNGQCTGPYTIPPDEYVFTLARVTPPLHVRFAVPFWTP